MASIFRIQGVRQVLCLAMLLSGSSNAQTCTVAAEVYLVYAKRSGMLSAGDMSIEPIKQFELRLTPISSNKTVRVKSSEFASANLACGRYSYVLSAPGCSISRGYVELSATRRSQIFGYVTVGVIEVSMNADASEVRIVGVNDKLMPPRSVTFTALDGRGMHKPTVDKGGTLSIELRSGVYLISFAKGVAVVASEIAFISPGKSFLIVNEELSSISFADPK